MVQIFLILIAWLVDMPLWLSIIMTVCMSLSLIGKTALAIDKVIEEDKK